MQLPTPNDLFPILEALSKTKKKTESGVVTRAAVLSNIPYKRELLEYKSKDDKTGKTKKKEKKFKIRIRKEQMMRIMMM